MTAGRLVLVKGHTYMIAALPQIISEIPNIRLVFVGDGELKDDLLRQAKTLGLENHVLFLGMRNDVPEIMLCSASSCCRQLMRD